MLPPTSIFRRMPGALALSQRRLFGALAYAYDSAELSFERLKSIARIYRLPENGLGHEEAGWVAHNRLSIVVDAWSCIDHLSRAQKLVRRFPVSDPRPVEIDTFIEVMRPATSIRNRIQHLDEDIFNGANCAEGNPVLGTVSWADARNSDGHIRYSISTGPQIDGGNMASAILSDIDGAGDVVDFRLMAADQTVHLDELMGALADFMNKFEITAKRAVISGMRAAALEQGVSLNEPRPHGITDMTFAIRFRRKPNGEWESGNGDGFAIVEVPPGAFDISEPFQVE